MKILLLSPYSEKLSKAIKLAGDELAIEASPISGKYCAQAEIDFIVSYGYRHIIRNDVLDMFPDRIINLHISLLPWCRGAHPRFWAVVEKRPLGITIHLIDEGLDTGNILIQREFKSDLELTGQTFRTAYEFLTGSIEDMFSSNWKRLRDGYVTSVAQQGRGSMHRASEINEWLEFMPMHWDTPIGDFLKLADSKICSYNSFREDQAPWR